MNNKLFLIIIFIIINGILISWYMDCLTDWLTDWLTDCPADLINQWINWLNDKLIY